MPDGKELQENARKGDTRKVAMAILIKRHTSASNIWIAERIGMGHDRSVSRSIKQGKDNEIISQRCKELEKCYNARTDPIDLGLEELSETPDHQRGIRRHELAGGACDRQRTRAAELPHTAGEGIVLPGQARHGGVNPSAARQ